MISTKIVEENKLEDFYYFIVKLYTKPPKYCLTIFKGEECQKTSWFEEMVLAQTYCYDFLYVSLENPDEQLFYLFELLEKKLEEEENNV